MTTIKMRWKDWENTCIEKAFEQNIHLKLIATVLGRTVLSVSKKINKLGLREKTSKRGRVKGKRNPNPWVKRLPQDLEKMGDILQTYAPLEVSCNGLLELREERWTSAPSLPKVLKRGECRGSIQQEKASFSLSFPLDYILSKDPLPPKLKRKKNFREPFYVSLHHVEQWAISEGFYRVESNLQQRGLSYWKGGRYFSKAQLLIYINQIRLERRLQPLAFYEENAGGG